MGLDISIIRTTKDIDLGDLYAIKEAVETGYDWYLGRKGKESDLETWKELKAKCKSITKNDLLEHIRSGDQHLVKQLEEIPESKFNEYLAMIYDSISEHEDGNTHLNFDYDKLPGTDIFNSCSWNLRALFLECKKNQTMNNQCGDFIYELDEYKIWNMAERWRRMSFKLKLARWIGYFSKRVGYNILRDCLQDLGVEDAFVDFQDARHYQRGILKVARDVLDSNNRYWIVSSY
jgi:hypothetical protein